MPANRPSHLVRSHVNVVCSKKLLFAYLSSPNEGSSKGEVVTEVMGITAESSSGLLVRDDCLRRSSARQGGRAGFLGSYLSLGSSARTWWPAESRGAWLSRQDGERASSSRGPSGVACKRVFSFGPLTVLAAAAVAKSPRSGVVVPSDPSRSPGLRHYEMQPRRPGIAGPSPSPASASDYDVR
jgi:hypothetical protein